MSRSINIGYCDTPDGPETAIEVRPPYFLFGTQARSMEFWSIPKLREIGIERLTELGVTDPIYFVGWDDMVELEREIGLLQRHIRDIDYHPELKAGWLSHLVYCYNLLVLTAPPGGVPVLTIG